MNNISHGTETPSFDTAYKQILSKIEQAGKTDLSTPEQRKKLLSELASFDLGRFLIEHKGMNGYWTHQVCTLMTKFSDKHIEFASDLEKFMFLLRPLAVATRERFQIFLSQAQQRLRNGVHFASVPSGLMGDLLLLDYSRITDFSLTGFDLDNESLERGKKLAKEQRLEKRSKFVQKDAWNLSENSCFDLISSSGLNIYVQENEKLVELYQEIFNALRPGGALLTSFLTPPPWIDTSSPWKLKNVDASHLRTQRIVYGEILNFKGTCYRTHEETTQQLRSVGFSNIQIIEDSAGIFPTVLAEKSF